MKTQELGKLIEEVALLGPDGIAECAADRSDPRLLKSFREALNQPRPFDQVENLEHAAITLWSDILKRPVDESRLLSECSNFFSEIGFLFKYKTYGTKIALPFGYSLFDLKPREGFSFQIHTEPKLEAFHVLASDEDSFIFISTIDEWNQTGKVWAEQLAVQHPENPLPPFAVHPRAGDVATIVETNIVHTVIGCMLEEYASCSVDAVVRLLDQNHRAEVPLPDRHQSVASVFARCGQHLPVQRLDRNPEGWMSRSFGAGERIISTSEQVIGYRQLLSKNSHHILESKSHVSSIICLSGTAIVNFNGMERLIEPGEVTIIPPCENVSCKSNLEGSVVAIHQVFTDLVGTQWTR